MTSGKLILLNGSSSAGKTSIGKALHKIMDEPFLCAGIDTFVHNMLDLEKYVGIDPPENSLAREGFYIETTNDNEHRSLVIHAGAVARRLLFGMHAAVAAMVAVGNNLIFDDVLYDSAYLENYLRVMQGIDVLFVGIRCPLEVLEQRELARGNRALGHARGHDALVHAHGVYDFEVDSSHYDASACAEAIKARFYNGQPFTAFEQLRKRQN